MNVYASDKHGRLSIHLAGAYASAAMLDSFSWRFQSQVCATDCFDYRPLHKAVVGANLPNISYLLFHVLDVDRNAQNKWGK